MTFVPTRLLTCDKYLLCLPVGSRPPESLNYSVIIWGESPLIKLRKQLLGARRSLPDSPRLRQDQDNESRLKRWMSPIQIKSTSLPWTPYPESVIEKKVSIG